MSHMNMRLRAHSFPAQSWNPLTAVAWKAAYWADDPNWSNPGAGNAVSSWSDGTGNGFTMLQGTGAKQPLFRTGVTALGGKSAVEFDGVNDFMQATTPVMTQPYSIVAALEVISLGSGDIVLSDSVGTGRGLFYWRNATGKWTAYTGTGFLISTPSITTGAHVARFGANNTSSTIVVDGVATTGSVGNSTGYTGITLGAINTGTALWSNIRLGFWGVYNGDITAAAGWPNLKSIMSGLYGQTLA